MVVSVPPDGYCDHWIIGGATEEELQCVEGELKIKLERAIEETEGFGLK
jgi:hypothetical protein